MRGVKDLILRLDNIMTLINEARGQSQEISDGGQRKQIFKGNGIRALVKDNNVVMTNEEGTLYGEVNGVNVGKGIVKELIFLVGIRFE